MKLDELKNVMSSRLSFKRSDYTKYDGINPQVYVMFENKVIGYFKYEMTGNDMLLSFDIDSNKRGLGFQSEALREFLRFVFLYEKTTNKITVNPICEKESHLLEKNNFKLVDGKYVITKDEYISSREKMAIFNGSFERLNGYHIRGSEAEFGKFPGVVDVIVINVRINKLLVTLRDPKKETNPSKWEITGGAISSNEEILEAVKREVKEETGLTLLDYEFVKQEIQKGRAFFTYMGYVDADENDVVLQPGETVDYKWLTPKEFVEFYEHENVMQGQKRRIMSFIDYVREGNLFN